MTVENLARVIRLAAIIPSSYADIIKLINQDVNPVAGFSALGATTVGLLADFESSIDQNLPLEEQEAARRDTGRKLALIMADLAVAIGYNLAVDAESFGAGAAATGNIIGLERTANKLAAKFANALEVYKIQQGMGIGDGTPYDYISDIPADVAMEVFGKSFLAEVAIFRHELEGEFEDITGIKIASALTLGRLGTRMTEAGLQVVAGEIPDFEKVAKQATILANQIGLPGVESEDFKMIATIAKGAAALGNHIRDGEFDAKDFVLLAEMSQKVAQRAIAHGITPEFAKDVESVANVVAALTYFVNGITDEGTFSVGGLTAVLTSSAAAIKRIQARGGMAIKEAQALYQTLEDLRQNHKREDGTIDTSKILSVTQGIVQKAVDQELMTPEAQAEFKQSAQRLMDLPTKLLKIVDGVTQPILEQTIGKKRYKL